MRMKRTTLLLLLTTTLLLSSCTSTPKATTTAATQTTEAIAQTDLPFGAEGLERGLFDGLEWGMNEEEIREKYGEENVGEDPSGSGRFYFDISNVDIYELGYLIDQNSKYNTSTIHFVDGKFVGIGLSLVTLGNNVTQRYIDFISGYLGDPTDIQEDGATWVTTESVVKCTYVFRHNLNFVNLSFSELNYYKSRQS